MGQSNIAAGATIGSNHNSRSADGEMIAGRGFWPGLCVSLKHNSKFASFTIIAKADFPAELNIPVPFSLISNDVANDKLIVMPAYWFMYNMYALARNEQKYHDRDHRTGRTQTLEFDYLAPDTINEIFDSLAIFEQLKVKADGSATVTGWENTNRVTEVIKVPQAITIFRELIQYYAMSCILKLYVENKFISFEELKKSLSAKILRSKWVNVGGQLIQEEEVEKLKRNIKSDKVKSWDDLHNFYKQQGDAYPKDKLNHAYTSLLELLGITPKQFNSELFKNLLQQFITTKEWMSKAIYDSREKDYKNPFRKMMYNNSAEMNKVVGKLEDNVFIQQQFADLDQVRKQVQVVIKKLKL